MALAQSSIGSFLASGAGRALRVVAGFALIGLGLGVVDSPVGTVLAAVGLVPLAAGATDVCVLSALLGGPFRGQAIRDLHRR
jgi:hypothetical protein